jgi:hypothetical protein
MNHLQRSTHSQPFEEVPCGIAKLANSQHRTSALFASTRAAIASFFSFRQRLERFFKNAREKALRHSERLRRLRLTVWDHSRSYGGARLFQRTALTRSASPSFLHLIGYDRLTSRETKLTGQAGSTLKNSSVQIYSWHPVLVIFLLAKEWWIYTNSPGKVCPGKKESVKTHVCLYNYHV